MTVRRNPKNPVTSWYWNDWLNDPCLKLCSYAAKGLWMDCLSLAATCSPFGHLSVDARPLTPDDLAVILPGNHKAEEIAALLTELLERGVCSRNAKGAIFSRRMVRDLHRLSVAQKNGKKGGNPSIGKERENSRRVNPRVNPTLNPNTLSVSNYYPQPPKGGFREIKTENDGGLVPWARRIGSFRRSGMWLPDWGPKPDEAGCLAPPELLSPP